jgi:hypothetical protein
VPVDAIPGQTIQLVLEATDDGQPALTRYERVVVSVAAGRAASDRQTITLTGQSMLRSDLRTTAPKAANDEDSGASKPRRASRAKAKAPANAASADSAPAEDGEDSEDGPPRRGWWQRAFGA